MVKSEKPITKSAVDLTAKQLAGLLKKKALEINGKLIKFNNQPNLGRG